MAARLLRRKSERHPAASAIQTKIQLDRLLETSLSLDVWMRHRQQSTGSLRALCFDMHALVAGLAFRKKLSMRLLLLFSAYWARTGTASASRAGINVALHAQSNYAIHGWVAGG